MLPSIPRRLDIIRAYHDRGGLVAAVLPIHAPRALLRAFDILPVEVWGPPKVDASYGAAHLQPYVCSIVRNALAFLETGGLDVVDVIVVPHTCDSLQGYASILIDFLHPRQPVIPVYLPRARRESDLTFLAQELGVVYRRLQEITHRSPSNEDLMASIRREEAADDLLALLDRSRRQLALTQIEFYRLIRSREYLPAERFSELAQAALSRTGGAVQNSIPVVLSGIVPEPMRIFESIAEMGGVVVADDLACCGRRLYPPGASEDAFHHMAESLLAAPPDAMRGSPIQERLDHLLRLIEKSGAKGVIFYDVKFCEPELYDLPELRQGLQATGIPSVAIEVDVSDPLSYQALTRIEAFMEMIA
jgi:benzoyl-CoA reductase/2-hydroxyglutaryl-CoA dehydratase subunit BcrC/BadD/HgdB